MEKITSPPDIIRLQERVEELGVAIAETKEAIAALQRPSGPGLWVSGDGETWRFYFRRRRSERAS